MIGAPGSTLQEPAKTTHYGNPWWTAFYLGFMLTVLVFQTVLTIWLLVGGLHNHNAAPLLTGMLLVPHQATFARFTSSRSVLSWALRLRQMM